MSTNRKIVTGLTASLALLASGVGCSDSGDKRVADSSASQNRTMTTATVAPAQPAHTTGSDYSESAAYDPDPPRRIVRVSATDPEIRGTTATATYGSRSNNRSTLVVTEAPPLMPTEVAPTPRGNDFWVNGYWRFENNKYVWEPGHMDKLRSNELYHPAKWTQTDQGWEFTPAYWD